MKTYWLRSKVIAGAALLLGSCSSDVVVGPSERVVDGLRLTLEVWPTTIERQESLTATLRVENLRDEEVVLSSSCTALALLLAFHDGMRVELEGTAFGCGDALTGFEIPARGILTRRYDIRATRWDGQPVKRGTYVLRTDFMVPDLPNLATTFRVE